MKNLCQSFSGPLGARVTRSAIACHCYIGGFAFSMTAARRRRDDERNDDDDDMIWVQEHGAAHHLSLKLLR